MSWNRNKNKSKNKGFKVDGVKIKNAKKQTVDGINFKSGLEAFFYTEAIKAGINNFQYEGKKFLLQDKFVSNSSGMELYEKAADNAPKNAKRKTIFGETTNNIRAITYTPDFICIDEETKTGYVVETKGWRMETFKIKWKMFKKHLKDNGYVLSLYTPNNKENVLKTIQSIKSKYYS